MPSFIMLFVDWCFFFHIKEREMDPFSIFLFV